VVWHHRRDSVGGYWRQQLGYGKAEALLERKWPAKYNALGHIPWSGRVYGKEHTQALGLNHGRIYQGVWGTAPFQSLYEPAPGVLGSLPLMPEWYLVMLGLGALAALGALWRPMLFILPLFVFALGGSLAQAMLGAWRASFPVGRHGRLERLQRRGLTGLLHLLQPLARLTSRLSYGLTPWRPRAASGFALPRPQRLAVLSRQWQAREARLEALAAALEDEGATVRYGGDYDAWDLELPGGLFGAVRLLLATEDYGEGWQLVRVRWWPKLSGSGLVVAALFAALGAEAAVDRAWAAAAALVAMAVLLIVRILWESGAATAAVLGALGRLRSEGER
jgi:hypothetical protein